MASALSSNPAGSLKVFKEPVVVKVLSGPHVSLESSEALCALHSLFFEKIEIQKVEEKDLHFKELGTRKILLVFPGALHLSDLNFSKAQQEEIKRLCEGGMIKIVAVSGGAFFVSKEIVFQKQRKINHRKMVLFDGICYGPAFSHDEGSWDASAEKVKVIAEKKISSGFATMIGGGFFIPSSELKEGADFEVLAKYEELEGEPIAAIACLPHQGEFNALLIGAHFEYEHHDHAFNVIAKLAPEKERGIDEVVTKLFSSTEFRHQSFLRFLTKLGFR